MSNATFQAPDAWRCNQCGKVKQPGVTIHFHQCGPDCPRPSRAVHPLRYCDRCWAEHQDNTMSFLEVA